MNADSTPALRLGQDGGQIARRIRHAHERFVSSHLMPPVVRSVVAESWRRCHAAGANADGSRLPPTRMSVDELRDHRSHHPLATLVPLFHGLLGEVASDGEHIFAVTDSTGVLLWVQGHPATLRGAERMNFAEGAVWSEAQAGTNAPGTALAVGRPVQIFATEHYNAAVQRWSCAAAPIREPRSGLLLGAIDITGGEGVAGPYAMALVRAAARLAEAELARQPPAGVLVPATADPEIRLTALGRDRAVVEVDGRGVTLSPRHSEIAVVLALAGAGRSAEALAVDLSTRELNVSSVRAEMTRLRPLLGASQLRSRPYAFGPSVRSDFGFVGTALAEGRLCDAVAGYTGPLLPGSEAPAVVEHRRSLEHQLRGALLATGDAVLLRHWVSSPWGTDDLAAWEALARRLPELSAQRAAANAQVVALDRELAAPPADRTGAVGPKAGRP